MNHTVRWSIVDWILAVEQGPALPPPQGPRGFMRTGPAGPSVLWRLEEGIQPCLSRNSRSTGQGPFIRGHPVCLQAEQGSGSHCWSQVWLVLLHVELRQGSHGSPVLFIPVKDRISRHSQEPAGVWFGDQDIWYIIIYIYICYMLYYKEFWNRFHGFYC